MRRPRVSCASGWVVRRGRSLGCSVPTAAPRSRRTLGESFVDNVGDEDTASAATNDGIRRDKKRSAGTELANDVAVQGLLADLIQFGWDDDGLFVYSIVKVVAYA